MPRPAGWTPTTPVDDVNLNANTKDVIGDLDTLNPIHFPNSDLVSAINAVPNMMSKVFYVDQISGNDLNNGSSTTPFATIGKAISSIPAGGWGYIILLSDVTLDSVVNNDNITAVIKTSTSLGRNAVISNVNNASKFISGNNNRLHFKDVDLNFSFTGLTTSIDLIMWNTHVYESDANFAMGGGLSIYNCNITINTDSDNPIFLANSIENLFIAYTNITYSNSTGNDFFYLTNAAICKNFTYAISTSSLTINGVSLATSQDIANHIQGLVYDGTATSVVVNMNSNIDL